MTLIKIVWCSVSCTKGYDGAMSWQDRCNNCETLENLAKYKRRLIVVIVEISIFFDFCWLSSALTSFMRT